MKEIKEEADRLVELYYYSISDIPEYNRDNRAIKCAIIDVSNTIKNCARVFHWVEKKGASQQIVRGLIGDIHWNKQVKQELENRLNK